MSIIGLELGAKLGTAAGEHGEVAAGIILIGVAGAMAAGWLLSGRARRQATAGPRAGLARGGAARAAHLEARRD
jgi:hypothetical protein